MCFDKVCIIYSLLSYAIAFQLQSNQQRLLGKHDSKNKYPFVVSLEITESLSPLQNRYCTGSLLTPKTVLSAAHCFLPSLKKVRFGNISGACNNSQCYKRIIKKIPHPMYRHIYSHGILIMTNDIGLLFVEEMPFQKFGVLGAMDYKTLTGNSVMYAVFGRTYVDSKVKNEKALLNAPRTLQVGEGMVIKCDHDNEYNMKLVPVLCIAPECSNKLGDSAPGDTGGPVMFNNKIVAIVNGDVLSPIGIYTPISPYLDWIHDVVT